MKQVTHEFHWEQVVASLIADHIQDFEDGFWQIGIVSQYTAGYHQWDDRPVPGNLQRVTGVVITKVDDWWPNTVLLEKGVIYSGPNRDQNGSLPSSESPGENSNSTGEGNPEC